MSPPIVPTAESNGHPSSNGYSNGTNGHSASSNGHGHGIPSSDSRHFGTNLIHVGSAADPSTSAVIPSISLSTTYAQAVPGVALNANGSNPFFEYSRSLNPNRLALERMLESLELPGAADGHASAERLPNALTFASGSAVTQAIVQAVVGRDGHIVSGSDVYGGTFRYFTRVAPTLQNVQTTFINTSLQSSTVSLSPTTSSPRDVAALETALESSILSAFRPNTKLVWLETPSNPTLLVSSIPLVAKLAHQRGALLVVDNTFLSPFYQTPILSGADIVVHSLTKYINGHSDVIMGAVISPHTEIIEKLRFLQNAGGAVPSSYDAWMVQRGAKTLELRMKRHGQSALELARWLEEEGYSRSWLREVIYPGLKKSGATPLEERIREIAWEQLSPQAREWELASGRSKEDGFSYGGMLSIRIGRVGDSASLLLKKAQTFLGALKIFTLAESLGGVESLAELPALMTHASLTPEARQQLGIDEGLVRLSVGIEDARDLKEDLKRAFEIADKIVA
ncbi:hypothetical protein BT69DRAFT_1317279 [Atractiella rhizophila]|nr:hypothetical protein BT69DRAFT_1317279 [Atractiella rhizophila]